MKINEQWKGAFLFGREIFTAWECQGQLTWFDISRANVGFEGNTQHLWGNERSQSMIHEHTSAICKEKEQVVCPRGLLIVSCHCIKSQDDLQMTNAVRTTEHRFQQNSCNLTGSCIDATQSHKACSASSRKSGTEAHHFETVPELVTDRVCV